MGGYYSREATNGGAAVSDHGNMVVHAMLLKMNSTVIFFSLVLMIFSLLP